MKKDLLIETNLSKCFILEGDNLEVVLKEGKEEFLEPDEAYQYCINLIRKLQIRKFGKVL